MLAQIDGPVGHKWYEFLDKHVCPGEGKARRSRGMMKPIASQPSMPASDAAPPTSVYSVPAWHTLADAPTSNKAVLIKTALDQLVWGPVMTLVFFAFLKTLEGRPDLILHTVSCSDALMVGRARGQL